MNYNDRGRQHSEGSAVDEREDGFHDETNKTNLPQTFSCISPGLSLIHYCLTSLLYYKEENMCILEFIVEKLCRFLFINVKRW